MKLRRCPLQLMQERIAVEAADLLIRPRLFSKGERHEEIERGAVAPSIRRAEMSELISSSSTLEGHR
jgi:hypothetical protein